MTSLVMRSTLLCAVLQVKGRFNAEAHATITPESVADDFWELYSRRNLDTWFVTRA